MTDVESVVIVDEIKTSSNDYTIGRLTLNKPKALNALDLEMAGPGLSERAPSFIFGGANVPHPS